MAQRPSPGTGPERLAPRDWSLRTKLAVVLAVPAVLAVVLGGLRILDQASQVDELDRASRFIAAQGEVSALIVALQQERLRATEHVSGNRTAEIGRFEEASRATDDARSAVRPAVESLYDEEPGLAGTHREVDQALARLPGLRTQVTASNAPHSAVISGYGDLIGRIVQLDAALLRGVDTAGTSGLTDALGRLALARNEVSLQESLMTAVARTALPAPPDLVELRSSQARLQQGLAEFRGALDADQRVRYAALIAGPTNNDRAALLEGVLAGTVRPGPGGFDERSSAALHDAFLGELDQAHGGVRDELAGTVAAARESAGTTAAVNTVVLVLALFVGAVVVGLIARPMIRSLRALRRGAIEVADARLPAALARMRHGSVPDTDIAPVAVDTREEIGEVGRAFDAVHAHAVRLAAEQATLQGNVNAMLVNLSRRSQTLVDRQLKLIEELAAGEQDPDQLGTLSRLDHLATRMRRNSENLLVLAGADVGQRSSEAVPATEVLRAAAAEVEQSHRVVVQPPPDLAIAGRVRDDLRHLLAELLENAAVFSPPESRVVVSSSRTADGALLVEIADQGVGMAPAELAQLNDQLRNSSDASVEESRRMGLFVVGRLAARHGIDVGLFAGSSVGGGDPSGRGGSGGAGSGLTARVWLPGQYVAERQGATPEPVPSLARPERYATPGALQPSSAAPTGPPGPVGGGLPMGSPSPVSAVELPPSRTGAGALFTPQTPAPPLPDPFAAERPPDPFAQPGIQRIAPSVVPPVPPSVVPPVAPPLPASVDVPSGWFRVVPPAVERAAAAAAGTGRAGASPGERPGREQSEHGPGGVQPAPRPAPATAHGRSWPEVGEPGSGRPQQGVALPERPPGADAPPGPPTPPPPGEYRESDFSTAADSGWRAVEAVRGQGEPTDVTAAGLPRRTPLARLVPGSAAATSATVPAPARRDAEAVRGRLASYQRGVRSGRESRERMAHGEHPGPSAAE